MTILYADAVRPMFMQRGITLSILGSNVNTAVSRAITLYSGVQPSADTIVSSWASYNTSFLVHWPNIPILNPFAELASPYITNDTLPSAVAASNSGTASWAILWGANPLAGTGAGQISNATIPTTTFIIVPVSDVFGTGILKLTTTTITAPTTYMFLDFTLKAGGP